MWFLAGFVLSFWFLLLHIIMYSYVSRGRGLKKGQFLFISFQLISSLIEFMDTSMSFNKIRIQSILASISPPFQKFSYDCTIKDCFRESLFNIWDLPWFNDPYGSIFHMHRKTQIHHQEEKNSGSINVFKKAKVFVGNVKLPLGVFLHLTCIIFVARIFRKQFCRQLTIMWISDDFLNDHCAGRNLANTKAKHPQVLKRQQEKMKPKRKFSFICQKLK